MFYAIAFQTFNFWLSKNRAPRNPMVYVSETGSTCCWWVNDICCKGIVKM